jgi:hypothetical protein
VLGQARATRLARGVHQLLDFKRAPAEATLLGIINEMLWPEFFEHGVWAGAPPPQKNYLQAYQKVVHGLRDVVAAVMSSEPAARLLVERPSPTRLKEVAEQVSSRDLLEQGLPAEALEAWKAAFVAPFEELQRAGYTEAFTNVKQHLERVFTGAETVSPELVEAAIAGLSRRWRARTCRPSS